MHCHNAAPYVEEAAASVLGQSHLQVELIALEDGSTDGSTEILLRLASENPDRITLIFQSRAGRDGACDSTHCYIRQTFTRRNIGLFVTSRQPFWHSHCLLARTYNVSHVPKKLLPSINGTSPANKLGLAILV
jgi:glycosyltransferase involved in cell wall biosynthesis